MPSEIKNRVDLETSPQRKQVLDIIQAGLDAIDTETVLGKQVVLQGDILTVQGQAFDLKKYKKIYVLGFGKTSGKVAEVLEKILGSRISHGMVICLQPTSCSIIKTVVGTHPLSSQANVAASQAIAEIAKSATSDDLVICAISGGGSALLCADENELENGTRLYNAYLKTNGKITELDTIRKHISGLKGGGLAKALYPATVIGLIFSDIAGDNFQFIASGPTYRDSTTLADAQALVDKYGLGKYELVETVKEQKYFERVHNFIITSSVEALNDMAARAEQLGLKAKILSPAFYEPAEDTFDILEKACQPGEVVLAGGEVRVIVAKQGGTGGRCHYLGLVSLEHIKPGQVFCAFASDGQDNSPSAGVIIDADSLTRAKEKKLDIKAFQQNFNGYALFEPLGHEQIFTGITGNNVADWMLFMKW